MLVGLEQLLLHRDGCGLFRGQLHPRRLADGLDGARRALLAMAELQFAAGAQRVRQAHIDAAVARAVTAALAAYDLDHADPNAGAQALEAGKPEIAPPSPGADTTPALPAPDPIERQAIADAAAAAAARTARPAADR